MGGMAVCGSRRSVLWRFLNQLRRVMALYDSAGEDSSALGGVRDNDHAEDPFNPQKAAQKTQQ